MSKRKLKVLFHSNAPFAPTGFGNYIKDVMSYLYKLDKFELYCYANGAIESHQDFQRFPWKTMGAIPPDQNIINKINSDPGLGHKAGYGYLNIDKVITTFQPDVYIAIEDPWIADHAELLGRFWWNKIHCLSHYTLDSRPLYKSFVDNIEKYSHPYVWSNFATKECHKLAAKMEIEAKNEKDDNKKKNLLGKSKSLKRVKTIRGTVNPNFRPLLQHQKSEIRKRFNIDSDTFIIGTASRNQIRKAYSQLIEGFHLFKKQNVSAKAKLLFLTDFRETGCGWDINKIAKEEFNIDTDDILACYKCRTTSEYFILPYTGQDLDNPKNPNIKKSLITIGINDPITIEQLNECFNLFDCFCLGSTSNGFECNLVQSMLCEIPTITNSYSATEDYFDENTGCLEIDQAFTREAGTGFIKAAVYPSSIAKQIKKVYEMLPQERKKLGKLGREWVLKNASIEVVGRQWEQILDALEPIDWDFKPVVPEQKNPIAEINFNVSDDEFINQLYYKILGATKEHYDQNGHNHWIGKIKEGLTRENIADYFRKVASDDLEKNKQVKFEDLLMNNGKKRFLFVVPESIGDLIISTALLESLRNSYPKDQWDIYMATKPEYIDILDGNKNIDKILEYQPFMDSEIGMTGQGDNKGFFDAYCFGSVATQRFLNYITNSNTAI